MEAKLRIDGAAVMIAEGKIEILGSISYRTSISTPLPNRFQCQLEGVRLIDFQLLRVAEP
jgi:hypothetical protein